MITGIKISETKTKQGFDVGVEFTDSIENVKHYKTFSFVSQREISHDLDNRIAKSCLSIEAKNADDKIKKDWTREELETLLKEKGLLTLGEKVEDLKAVVK